MLRQVLPVRFTRITKGLASGLALAALLASPAAAQRRTEWQIGVGKQTGNAHIGVTIGSHGVHIGAGVRDRHCPPPIVRPCPPPQPSGRWETRCERVWVPGPVRQVWVPPVYETRFDHCGRPYQVEVRCGYWDTIQEPGYWEQRETRVWVPCEPQRPRYQAPDRYGR